MDGRGKLYKNRCLLETVNSKVYWTKLKLSLKHKLLPKVTQMDNSFWQLDLQLEYLLQLCSYINSLRLNEYNRLCSLNLKLMGTHANKASFQDMINLRKH